MSCDAGKLSGVKGYSKWAHSDGYMYDLKGDVIDGRYDGLYEVVKHWEEKGMMTRGIPDRYIAWAHIDR